MRQQRAIVPATKKNVKYAPYTKRPVNREQTCFEKAGLGTYENFAYAMKKNDSLCALSHAFGYSGLGVSLSDLGCKEAKITIEYNQDTDWVYSTKIEFRTSKSKNLVTKKIGFVGVDSGSLIIIDPINVLPMDDSFEPTTLQEMGINDSSNLVDCPTGRDYSPHPISCEKPGLGYYIGNFGGDGTFPVWATYADDQLLYVAIDFETAEFDKDFEVREPNLKVKTLGQVNIHSNRLIICDPCYVL